MAAIQLRPPEPFNFRAPDEWPRWCKRFQQFRVASGLADEAAERQVSTFLYCMGDEAEAILTATHATEGDRKDYESVRNTFDTFFNVRRNVIFERARFNRRSQQPGESSEQYILALYSLAANCNYGELEGEMIRDRLVVGIRDSALSERLQLDAGLTLEKAKTTIRQKESVHEQQNILSGAVGTSVDGIRTSRTTAHNREKHRDRREHRRPSHIGPTRQQRATTKCTRCGREPHQRSKCPARDATCHKCQKKGHYGAQCRGGGRSASVDESGLDTAFLDAAEGSTTSEGTAWYADIEVGSQKVTFKLDTGAEVTAMCEGTYRELIDTPPLYTPRQTLCGPSRKPLPVLGQCKLSLSSRGRSSCQQVFIIRGLRSNLLGLPAIKALNLATRLDETVSQSAPPLSERYIHDRFKKVFQGLGNLGEEFEIKLKTGATPFALFTPRRVALPLRKKVEAELKRMERMGVISKVDAPTPWCAGMVVAPKKSGSVRICVDLKPLNQSVLREVHPLPRVEDTLAQLTGARVFSKLDANSGFWQIPLSPASRLLTTFITPFGRFCFNKMPFGVSSAPEHFQKRMSRILTGLEGVGCHMDDVLVYGSDKSQHDARLLAVLQRIEESGATLNTLKCEFNKTTITFLGHKLDQRGIQADPEKTSAIRELKTPTTVPELRRFMGMVNQLGKFTPNLAHLTQPLRELLSKGNTWVWGPEQSNAFASVKEELSKPTILALYDPEAPTILSADASSYGLGAVLLQKSGEQRRPVAYASRSMTDTEKRYAQIEKEALAITWAAEKFTDYILGKQIQIETDHKPLVPLLTNKQLDSLPPRILRFRLRMDRFTYTIRHVPGKELYTADTLSRAPLPHTGDSKEGEDLAELLVETVTNHLPVSRDRLKVYRQAQHTDPVCSTLMKYCASSWPERHRLAPGTKPYWPARGELTLGEELLLYNGRIVVPSTMQEETLRKLHHGHQGIQRCRLRANTAVWWPGISRKIEDLVSRCKVCCREALPQREPLRTSPLPDHPWQKVATDLFELKGVTYLIIVDYFSRFPELIQLKTTTSRSVISALKVVFARNGIPEVVVSDNGPQYSSAEFTEFGATYGFTHTTSSPHYPQSNGLAERTVRTAKNLLKESPDPSLALLAYRTTPLAWCGLSPAELIYGRRLRTDVPQTKNLLTPGWEYLEAFRRKDKEHKEAQKRNYDTRHRVRDLPELPPGTSVWVTTNRQPVEGTAKVHPTASRSYNVTTATGSIRRNRTHINVVPEPPQPQEPGREMIMTRSRTEPPQPQEPGREMIMTRSRTGTPIFPPDRL